MELTTNLKTHALSLLDRLTSNYVYETSYGQVKMVRKGGRGFLKAWAGGPDPEELFLSTLDLRGRTVFDIGGYIGLMTIFFAERTKPTGKVVVFEPNQENCVKIDEHLRLNRVTNARLVPIGLGDKKESRPLAVRHNGGATGSMEERIQSRILNERGSKQWQVDVDTVDGAILAHSLPLPDFLKVDVEGMEYNVLLGAPKIIHDCSPEMMIEIHGADESSKTENICRIVELLQSWHYSVWHVESQQNITFENYSAAKRGHIYCRRVNGDR